MIIYRATKKQFVTDVFNNTIADNIDEAFYEHLGRHTSPNEVRSWQNSMQYMSRVVNTPELPDDTGVAIEYQIPLTAKRVDFIVSGLNSQKREQLVIIELKRDGNVYSPVLEILRILRIKPSGFSKYCIGSVMTNKNLKRNIFKAKMVTLSKLANTKLN